MQVHRAGQYLANRKRLDEVPVVRDSWARLRTCGRGHGSLPLLMVTRRRGRCCGTRRLRFLVTGDMTLSVVDADGLRVLTVDMLRHKTMAADLNGDRLARACNDLTVLAACPALSHGEAPPVLPHPDAGLSPGPWRVEYGSTRRRLRIISASGALIAERAFPRSAPDEQVQSIVARLRDGMICLGGNRPSTKLQ